MALRSVMHSHPCRNFPPVTVTALDSLPILPDLAKDLNLPPDSALAIPRHPADLSFVGPGFVAVRLVTVAVVVAAAARLSFDPSCSADFSGAVAAVASDVASVSQSSSSRSPAVPPRPYLVGPASM